MDDGYLDVPPDEDDLPEGGELVEKLVDQGVIKEVVIARFAEGHKHGAIGWTLPGDDVLVHLVPCLGVNLQHVYVNDGHHRPGESRDGQRSQVKLPTGLSITKVAITLGRR